MYGKDHSTNTPIYDRICEILGQRAPEHFTYELFLDENGEKISKSKGNGLSIDEWLTYASTESLSYFMFGKPKTAKRLWWDVIPKAVDEYHQQLKAFPDQPLDQQLANPVWHIHGGNPPESKMVVPFAMLLNLASVSHAEDKAKMWGFIRRYAPEASPETHPDLDAAAGFAVRYYNDFVPRPRRGGGLRRALLQRLREAHEGLPGARPEGARGDGGPAWAAEGVERWPRPRGASVDGLRGRQWFKALYEVLLGASQGPRFGGFIALYGVDESIALIEAGLKGDLS